MRRLASPIALLCLVWAGVPATAAPGDRVTIWESGSVADATLGAAELTAAILGGELTIIRGGTLRLMAVTRDGVDVQRPAAGFGYPMSVTAVPSAEAAVVDARLPAVLGQGRAVMSERSAALRGAEVGDVITMEGWNGELIDMALGAILPDDRLGFAEIVMSEGWADRLDFDRLSSLVISGAGSSEVVTTFDSLAPDGPIRVGTISDPITFVDPVLSTVAVKERFGEFAFRPTGVGDAIEIDDVWVDANIVTVDLPRLGVFKCNRAIVPSLRGALTEMARSGVLDLIDPVDFQLAGGCFNSRMARGGDKGFALSRHAWGVAVDLNPSTNLYGDPVTLDPRLGSIMQAWGFSWGANWTVPDGMHFEWVRYPDPAGSCPGVRLLETGRAAQPWSVEMIDEPCAT